MTTVLRGPHVLLRPFRPGEVDALVDSRHRERAAGLEALGTPDRDALAARVASSGRMTDDELFLAVEVEGRLVGEIQARRSGNVLPPGVFELGIELFEESDRGRGHGGEALALLTSHLFERGAHRVQATTDVANAPMRRALERIGFPFEGVLRGFMPSSDGPLDYAMYATTSDDWDDTTWTHPS